MRSNRHEKMGCARNNLEVSGMTLGGICQVLLAVNLALCLVALTGCDSQTEQDKPLPKKVKSFDETIAEARCLSCHLPDNKVGAPSWKDVAKKYKKDKASTVEAHLTNKIVRGGSGVWGRVNMPPHPELSKPELKVMVRGILASDSVKTTGKSDAPAQKK